MILNPRFCYVKDIIALIAVSAIAAMQGLGNKLKTSFSNVSTNMKAS